MTIDNYTFIESNSKLFLQTEESSFAQLLINRTTEAAFCLGANGKIIYVNDAICLLSGYCREELLSMTLDEIDVDFSPQLWSEFWQALKLHSLSFESRYRAKTGEIVKVEVTISYAEDKGQEFCCAFARKKNEQEEKLKLNEARFRTLAETTEASIFLIQQNNICYANPAAEILTGYTIQELLNNFNLDKLILSKKLRQVIKQDELVLCEYQEMQILTKNGNQRWLACTVALLDGMFDFAGKPVELITAIDITDYKQAELKLCQALEQAKLLSEQKERFVSMLCHQFRTPLNVASFSADLLKRHSHQWTEEKKCSYFGLIQLGIKQISELLDEILLFGKAEAALLEYQPREMDLNLFCNEIASQVELANSNQISINFISQNISQNEFITADFDPNMLQFILTNLLSNAIKYSPENNSVTLELYSQDKNIIFKIKDTGIGIPEKDRERIFEPFYRGSNIDSIPGTGLGLSIVKTIIDLHGGEIILESQVGVGTTFTITLSPGT